MSNEYDDSYDNEMQPYIDSFEHYDIASKLVYCLREYIMGNGLDMLTSKNAINDMIMLL